MKLRRRGFCRGAGRCAAAGLRGSGAFAGHRRTRRRAQDRHSRFAGPWFLGESAGRFTWTASARSPGRTFSSPASPATPSNSSASSNESAKGSPSPRPSRQSKIASSSVRLSGAGAQHARAGQRQRCLQRDSGARRHRGRHAVSTVAARARTQPASAVLSDLADAALDLKCWHQGPDLPAFVPHARDGAIGAAHRRGGFALLRALQRRGSTKPGTLARIAAILGGGQNRHLLGHSARGARGKERALDPDDPRRRQCRHAQRRWDKNCPALRRQRAARDAPRGEF